MMLAHEQHRDESTRLKGWDYSAPGDYFITICTEHWKHHFGEIADAAMELSETGKVAERFWREIPRHFPYAELDAFIVMPNHVHGIIRIVPDDLEPSHLGVFTKRPTLSVIVNHYKHACAHEIKHGIAPDFSWQSHFYDHIIRDNDELEKMRAYIRDNPANWQSDEYFAK